MEGRLELMGEKKAKDLAGAASVEAGVAANAAQLAATQGLQVAVPSSGTWHRLRLKRLLHRTIFVSDIKVNV